MAEQLPLASFGQDYFKRTDGNYCAILAVTPINMELLSIDEATKAVQAVREAVNSCPGRSQILVSSERLNLDDYLDYLRTFADTAEDADQLERLMSLMDDIKNRSIKSEKILKFYLVVESQFQEKEAPALTDLATSIKSITDILKQESLYLHRLQKPELISLFYQKLNPNASLYQPLGADADLEDIYPALIDTTPLTYYLVDETYHKSFTITGFPKSRDNPAWLSPVLDLPLDMDLSITLVPTDKEAILQYLNRSAQTLEFKRAEVKRDKLATIKLIQNEEDTNDMLDKLSNDNETLFYATIVITIRAASLEDLKYAEKTLRTRIASKQMVSKPILKWAFQPLLYTLPLCYKGPMEEKIRYNLPAEIVGSMQPFNSSTISGKDGIVLGINEQSHDLIILSKETKKANPHTVALALTRSGKSYWMYGDTLRQLDQGQIVIDIDPERERYSIPGNHVVFGLNHKNCVNVFHIRSTVSDSDNNRAQESTRPGEYLRLKIDRNQSFFHWIYPELDAVTAAAIDAAQTQIYADKGLTYESEKLPDVFPTLSDFYTELKKGEGVGHVADFLMAMTPFIGKGNYARMFDGQTNWGFAESRTVQTADGPVHHFTPHKYTRLDIHELPKRAQAPLMDLLISDIWEFVKIDRTIVKNVKIDELWILADPENPHTLQFVYEMVKRGAKYGVHLTTATQNVSDLLRTKPGATVAPGQAIISNSTVKLLLRMDEKEIQQISEFVPLSEKERKKIEKAEQGHGIILVGTQHAEIHTFMTPGELKLYDPEQYNLIYRSAKS